MNDSALANLIEAAENIPYGFVAVKSIEHGSDMIALNGEFSKICGYASKEELMAASGGVYMNIVYSDDLRSVLGEVERSGSIRGHHSCRLITKQGGLVKVEITGMELKDPVYGKVHTLYVTPAEDWDYGDTYDHLTGLYSRTHLIHWVEEQQQNNERQFRDMPWEVIYLNVVGFREYNEIYGYDAGDDFLKRFAGLVRKTFRSDYVARAYADQFLVFCSDGNISEKIEKLRADAADIDERFPTRIEAGHYDWNDQNITPEMAANRANLAFESVRGEMDTAGEYTGEQAKKLERKLYIQNHIDTALEKGWITVYLQPVIRTLTGKVTSFEALSRWNDPKYGLISPSVFVPALEEKDISFKLARFVIDEVAGMIARFERDTGSRSLPVSLNLSRKDFIQFDPFTELEAAVERHHIRRNQVSVEITETTVMDNPEKIRKEIIRFHNAGYQVWMDDFGASYSSLNVLKDFEFDEIKLDRVFISRLNEKSRCIVRNMVNMAKEMGIRILCEGVETKEQAEFLLDLGCERIQGFYYSRPLPYEELMPYLKQSGTNPESVSERILYDRIADVKFDESSSWLFAVHRGENLEIVYRSPRLRKEAERRNIGELFLQGEMPRSDSDFSLRMRMAIDSAVLTGRKEILNYYWNGVYYSVSARMLFSVNGSSFCKVEIRDTTVISKQLLLANVDPVVQCVMNVYDSVYRLDLDTMKVEVLASDFIYEQTGDIRGLNVSNVVTYIQEEDRERFLRWFNPHKIRTYFHNASKRQCVSAFRVLNGRSVHWEEFRMIRMGREGQVLLFLTPAVTPAFGHYLALQEEYENQLGELSGRKVSEWKKPAANRPPVPARNAALTAPVPDGKPGGKRRIRFEELQRQIRLLRDIFDVVRVVDVEHHRVMSFREDRGWGKSGKRCFEIWGQNSPCVECTSAEAIRSRSTVSKFETDGRDIFAVISRYLVLNGKPVVMEIAKRMDGSSRLAASEQEAFIQMISSCRRKLYIDSLAQIHNRRYYDEIMSAEYVSAVAIIDIDGFKQINDQFGHLAGDEVLFRVGQAIDSCVRSEDEVRYGGDEFVVAFCEITRDCFEDKLKQILGEIGRIHLTRHPEIRLSVSIGGIHRRGFVRDLFDLADLALYRAKRQRGLYRIEE